VCYILILGARRSPHLARWREIPASPRNRPRSYPVIVAGHIGVYALEQPTHGANVLHRNELEPSLILQHLDLLARFYAEATTQSARDDYLKSWRDGHRCHVHTRSIGSSRRARGNPYRSSCLASSTGPIPA